MSADAPSEVLQAWMPEREWAQREFARRFATARDALFVAHGPHSSAPYQSSARAAIDLVENVSDDLRTRVRALLSTRLLGDPAAIFAVVDEGPGLSGSSFGAVADWLETHGVDRGRIRFYPGHGGEPGAQAAPAHRERWRAADRHVVEFDAL